jgi:hypothetical protein
MITGANAFIVADVLRRLNDGAAIEVICQTFNLKPYIVSGWQRLYSGCSPLEIWKIDNLRRENRLLRIRIVALRRTTKPCEDSQSNKRNCKLSLLLLRSPRRLPERVNEYETHLITNLASKWV